MCQTSWVISIAKLNDSCFCYVTAAIFVSLRRRQAWRPHTKLYKFGWHTSAISWFSSVMWSKLKIVTVQLINSRIWDMIDDCNINNLAKNQVSAAFNSRAIRRSVSSKFIGICMETPCWCPSGWASTWRPETNRNICHWVLLQKRKFISRGTQEH